mmetsp:Transcript_70078/g.212020  ORF Transcript_70078/g.212020 Transcript_70078/m.212020 type:complete len:219 (-) Transcript_70078:18-674(-)
MAGGPISWMKAMATQPSHRTLALRPLSEVAGSARFKSPKAPMVNMFPGMASIFPSQSSSMRFSARSSRSLEETASRICFLANSMLCCSCFADCSPWACCCFSRSRRTRFSSGVSRTRRLPGRRRLRKERPDGPTPPSSSAAACTASRRKRGRGASASTSRATRAAAPPPFTCSRCGRFALVLPRLPRRPSSSPSSERGMAPMAGRGARYGRARLACTA